MLEAVYRCGDPHVDRCLCPSLRRVDVGQDLHVNVVHRCPCVACKDERDLVP